ncbi:hypothetical protein A8V01_09985 [Novosphingobium guangzhouense]|uniref:Uncharacterized protein n=2 Tax=Novosphingobium guangzhouense TaxID=1850347 RepID=A0A2K2FTT6_9SPHN|nr:hypothetical protein A8V01_09985 [Novosphingobium guangzhouense]
MLAAIALYLAAPHQRWGALPAEPAALGWGGAAMLVIGLVLLLSWAGPATTLFIAATLLMTTWSIVPVAIAWARRERGGSR